MHQQQAVNIPQPTLRLYLDPISEMMGSSRETNIINSTREFWLDGGPVLQELSSSLVNLRCLESNQNARELCISGMKCSQFAQQKKREKELSPRL